ncbi:exopolysaccharide production repressor protein [Bradyrhizobium sp. Arg314]
MALVLSTNALAVYFVSHSIGAVIVTTLSCALGFETAYFASVLFLIWRSGPPGSAAQKANGDREVWRQSPTCRENEE